MLVKATNGTVDQFPYTIGQLRRDNPNTSFPKTVSDTTLAAYNVYPVTQAAAPTYDEATQKLVTDAEPTLVNGAWILSTSAVDMTADEITQNDASVATAHRATRNELLASSDWTQMNDSPLSSADKTAWAVYRDELRNITDQDYWPHMSDEDWPVSP